MLHKESSALSGGLLAMLHLESLVLCGDLAVVLKTIWVLSDYLNNFRCYVRDVLATWQSLIMKFRLLPLRTFLKENSICCCDLVAML